MLKVYLAYLLSSDDFLKAYSLQLRTVIPCMTLLDRQRPYYLSFARSALHSIHCKLSG